jgi:hypothetical protein
VDPMLTVCSRAASGAEHQARHSRRGALLHGRDGVAIGVEGDRDVGVAEDLGDDLGVDARQQHHRGGRQGAATTANDRTAATTYLCATEL